MVLVGISGRRTHTPLQYSAQPMTMPSAPDPYVPSAAGTGGDLSVLGDVLRYAASYAVAQEALDRALEGVRKLPDWVVITPGCIEGWTFGAIVAGPPAVFLFWPFPAGLPARQWDASRNCRQYVHDLLGPDFRGAVELVYFHWMSPRASVEREVFAGGRDISPTSLAFVSHHELDAYLPAWELLPGIEPLSPQLLGQIREMAKRPVQPGPPDGGADRLPLLRGPGDW